MKYLLSILLFCTIAAPAYARQITDTANMPVRWKITVRPFEFFVRNFPLTVEKVFDRMTIGLTVAYRTPYQNSGKVNTGINIPGGYTVNYPFNGYAQGMSVEANSKQYIFSGKAQKHRLYVDAALFYRRWWFEGKNTSHDRVEGTDPHPSFNGLRNEYLNVVGAKALIGTSVFSHNVGKLKLVMDFYGGVGLRYKTWKFETFNGTVEGQYYTYNKETGNKWAPSIQGGVQVGIGF